MYTRLVCLELVLPQVYDPRVPGIELRAFNRVTLADVEKQHTAPYTGSPRQILAPSQRPEAFSALP